MPYVSQNMLLDQKPPLHQNQTDLHQLSKPKTRSMCVKRKRIQNDLDVLELGIGHETC